MADALLLGWPATDAGPIVDSREAKRSRGRILLITPKTDHPVRPNFGTSMTEALFEAPTVAVNQAIRVDARKAFRTYEPGLFVPRGDRGGGIVEVTPKLFGYQINAIDIDEPERVLDPLEVRLRRG